MSNIDANLLSELHIAGTQREPVGEGVRRWLWLAIGSVWGVALLAGAGWWFLVAQPFTVRTVAAMAPGVGSSGGAVLQATGYVTARRQATVSHRSAARSPRS